MPVKKASPKKAVKPTLVPKPKAPVQKEPTKVTTMPVRLPAHDAEEKARLLREKFVAQVHTKTVDGYGKPIENKPKVDNPTAVEFIIRLADGTALHADGHKAGVLFRFIQECQTICISQNLAGYNGAGFDRIAVDEAEDRWGSIEALLEPIAGA